MTMVGAGSHKFEKIASEKTLREVTSLLIDLPSGLARWLDLAILQWET